MAKVIVERPRYGSSLPSKKKGYRRSTQRQTVDELPRNESMLGRWHGMQRRLNETLGPMVRFLRSNVGRPWNKVHQDLCEHVSFDNAVQKHVLAHVFQYVTRLAEIRNGEVFDIEPRWRRTPLQPGQMYVCPRTGLLKVVRPTRSRRPTSRIQGGPNRQFHLRDGSWWEVTLRKLPENPGELWDLWLEQDVAKLTKDDLKAAYGGELLAISKRALRPAEVKDLLRGLRKRNQRRAGISSLHSHHEC